jgi:CheY-like chemotaxis protein
MVVDDNPVYNFTFTKHARINKLCSSINSFQKGKDAISYLADPANRFNLPDVIFLDVYMPEMNGWNFAEAYREIKPRLSKEIIIFLVTSSVNSTDEERMKKYPELAGYLLKPTNEKEMAAIFQTAAQYLFSDFAAL